MSFRFKIIFLGAIGALVIIGLVLGVVFRTKKTPAFEKVSDPSAIIPAIAPAAVFDGSQPAAIKKTLTAAEVSAAAKESAIKNQAKNFVERFGSYSAAADFSNFEEIKPLATASLAAWLADYKKQLLAKQTLDFLGITTKAISQKIISSDSNNALVMVSTQREEKTHSGSVVSYRDMLVKLVWQNNQWLIDGAYWQ